VGNRDLSGNKELLARAILVMGRFDFDLSKGSWKIQSIWSHHHSLYFSIGLSQKVIRKCKARM